MSEYFDCINFLEKKIPKEKILKITFKNLDQLIKK